MPGAGTGLFWTTAIDNDDVEGNGNGGATLTLTNMPISDGFQIFTSPMVPATLSLRAKFTPGASADLSTTANGSTFAFVGSQATVSLTFSVTSQTTLTDTSAFAFSTNGSGTTGYGRIGKEKNGSFAST